MNAIINITGKGGFVTVFQYLFYSISVFEVPFFDNDIFSFAK